jgi:GxxExxY protein
MQGRQFDELSHTVIECAIEVHRVLGPGLLESAYERVLGHELAIAGLQSRRQNVVNVQYKGIDLETGYRIDLLVEVRLVLELKTVERLLPIHSAQLLSYLRLSDFQHGLLINFHSLPLKNGIKRLVR